MEGLKNKLFREQRMNFDLVIHNGTILTVNSEFDIIKNGYIGIRGDRIERVEVLNEGQPFPQAREVIDAKGGIVMPGLVNTHTHLPMTLFRGLADDQPLAVWLNDHIFPAESQFIRTESVRYGTLLACAELIMSGTTTCCDGYFLEDEVALAVCDSGLRAVLGQGIIDFPSPGVPDPSDNVKNAEKFIEKWKGRIAAVTPSVFCHSPYTCSEDTLKKAKKAADSKGVLFQIHAAETKNERDQTRFKHQTTPIKYLDRIGVLDQNTLLVHTIWVDSEDIEIISCRGAKVAVTTESEMKLASGIAPIPKFLRSGITVGLGTDGCASNNNLDLFQEMDLTAKLHKVCTLDPTAVDAKSVIEMATIGGAKAIGLDKEIGSLEPGKQADMIIIDVNKPHLVPMYDPVSHIVYTVKGSDIRDVIISGRMILKDQEMLTLDTMDILENVALIAEGIKETNSRFV
jgi:5-methylthioadenosine/S-adenosylhomocysteine deaminase